MLTRRWWTPWQNIRGAGAQKATAAPTYQEDDDENPDIEIDEDGVRMWLANAAEPQDLTFDVPRDWNHGDPVTIQGPHGPLQVGYKGEEHYFSVVSCGTSFTCPVFIAFVLLLSVVNFVRCCLRALVAVSFSPPLVSSTLARTVHFERNISVRFFFFFQILSVIVDMAFSIPGNHWRNKEFDRPNHTREKFGCALSTSVFAVKVYCVMGCFATSTVATCDNHTLLSTCKTWVGRVNHA